MGAFATVRQGVAAGTLDSDDIGAKVGEDHGGHPTDGPFAEVDDAEIVEQFRHGDAVRGDDTPLAAVDGADFPAFESSRMNSRTTSAICSGWRILSLLRSTAGISQEAGRLPSPVFRWKAVWTMPERRR